MLTGLVEGYSACDAQVERGARCSASNGGAASRANPEMPQESWSAFAGGTHAQAARLTPAASPTPPAGASGQARRAVSVGGRRQRYAGQVRAARYGIVL